MSYDKHDEHLDLFHEKAGCIRYSRILLFVEVTTIQSDVKYHYIEIELRQAFFFISLDSLLLHRCLYFVYLVFFE